METSKKDLNFIKTFTPEQFKSVFSTGKINVYCNPKTSKLFFAYGSKGGKVSAAGLPKNAPVFSICHESKTTMPTPEELKYLGDSIEVDGVKVSDPRAGGYFFLLHEEGQGGAEVIASF